MACALITSIFSVSLSMDTFRISFSKLLMNFRYPGGTDFSRVEESKVGAFEGWFSLGSVGSSNGNSKRTGEESFVVIIMVGGSWLVVVESSEPFAWLELGQSCFDLLLWARERGSGSSDLSLLQTNERDNGSTGLSGALHRPPCNRGQHLRIRVKYNSRTCQCIITCTNAQKRPPISYLTIRIM